MSHLPRGGVCQGNFAASVKEILPIYEGGPPCDAGPIWASSPQIAEGLRQQLLDRPRSSGEIRFTQTRMPRRSSCPNPWTPKANRSVSKAS